jgi:hypothetical protein
MVLNGICETPAQETENMTINIIIIKSFGVFIIEPPFI